MSKKESRCSFCGNPRSEVNLLIAGISGHICDHCVGQAQGIIKEQFIPAKVAEAPVNLLLPQEIKRNLDEYVIGQDDAKKSIVCCCI